MPQLIIKPDTTYNEQRTLNVETKMFNGTTAVVEPLVNAFIAGLPVAKGEDVFIDSILMSQYANNTIAVCVTYGWWTG